MATPDKDHSADTDASPAKPRKRHWFWRLLRGVTIFTLILLVLNFTIGFLYHGPKTMPAIVAVMPGVPIFPLAKVSPSNPRAQRAMALPLCFMRLQGAKHADAAQILAPADDYFVTYWYRQSAMQMGWQLAGEEKFGGGRRLVFLREREGLQVVIGKTSDIFTPVQLIYLSGMADAQLRQLASGLPKEVDHDFPPPPQNATPKPVTPPTVAPPLATPTTPNSTPVAIPNPTGNTSHAQPSTTVRSTGSSPTQAPTQATNRPTTTRRATSAPRSSSARTHHRTQSTTRHHRSTVHRRPTTSTSTRRSAPTPRPSTPTPSYRKPIDGKATDPSSTETTPQAPTGE